VRLLLVYAVLLFAWPALATDGVWEPATLRPGDTAQFTFKALVDESTHALDARACGTVTLRFEQDTTGGGGTGGAATVLGVSMLVPTHSQISSGTTLATLGATTAGSPFTVRPGFLYVHLTAEPSGISRITAYCAANASK